MPVHDDGSCEPSQRNALVYLGLVPPGSPAMDTEQCMAADPSSLEGRGPKTLQVNWAKGKHTAAALRRLADGIERGDVEVIELFVDSRLCNDEWLCQNLHIQYELRAREFKSGAGS